MGKLTEKTLKGHLADKEFRDFLVSADLVERHCLGEVAAGFFRPGVVEAT